MDRDPTPNSPAAISFGLDDHDDGEDLFLMRLEHERRQKKRRLVAGLVAFFFLGQAFVTAIAVGVRWAKIKVPVAAEPAPQGAQCR
jgi:hypothetical protein